jgi:hypothetical protein
VSHASMRVGTLLDNRANNAPPWPLKSLFRWALSLELEQLQLQLETGNKQTVDGGETLQERESPKVNKWFYHKIL